MAGYREPVERRGGDRATSCRSRSTSPSRSAPTAYGVQATAVRRTAPSVFNRGF